MIRKFDIFISYAREDKDTFVKLLADEFRRKGLAVWYDEYELHVGHSIREQINKGISNCRHGVVVLSKNFYAKTWPQAELNALYGLMMNDPEKRLMPIAYIITLQELIAIDPLIADIKLVFADSVEDVPSVVKEIIEGMIYHERGNRFENRTLFKHTEYRHNYYNPPEDIPKYGYKFDPPYEFDKLEQLLRPREILMCFLDDSSMRSFKFACHITCRERLREFQRDFSGQVKLYAVQYDKLTGNFDYPFDHDELNRIMGISG